LTLLAASGCGRLWNADDASVLEADVDAVLAGQGVSAPLDCHMLGATRNGVCKLRAQPDDVATLAGGLGLKPASPVDYRGWESPAGCRAEQGFGPAFSPVVYTAGRRNPKLPGLEFLILYQERGTDRVCLELGYTYR
jgi:hypothetical protein